MTFEGGGPRCSGAGLGRVPPAAGTPPGLSMPGLLCAGNRGWCEDGNAGEGTLWSLRPPAARARWRIRLGGT